jgi:hypothetical protein
MTRIQITADGVSVIPASVASGRVVASVQLDLTDGQIGGAVETMVGMMPAERATRFLRHSFPDLFDEREAKRVIEALLSEFAATYLPGTSQAVDAARDFVQQPEEVQS